MKIEILAKCQFTQNEDTIDAGSIKNAKLITHHLGHDEYKVRVTTNKGFHIFEGMNCWYHFSVAFAGYYKQNQEMIPTI